MCCSKQRGFLELDLLVGLWAEREVPKMDVPTLQQFSTVLDQENPDLFGWLTSQQAAPAELLANGAFQKLKAHVDTQLTELRDIRSQAPAGATWVRGWDDSSKSPSSAGHAKP